VLSLNPVAVRAWKRRLSAHPSAFPQDFLFVYDNGQQMKESGLIQILHRLSHNAKSPKTRHLHQHALRHAASTTLSTVLIDSTSTDVMAAHRKAAAIERVGLK